MAQHSCLVEAIAVSMQPDMSDAWLRTVLLHDAPEYVVGDVITPLKAALGADFAAIEARLLIAVHLAFGLPPDAPPALTKLIKQADRAAAGLEARVLAGFSEAEAGALFGRPAVARDAVEAFLTPWPSPVAEARFRDRVLACRETQSTGHRAAI